MTSTINRRKTHQNMTNTYGIDAYSLWRYNSAKMHLRNKTCSRAYYIISHTWILTISAQILSGRESLLTQGASPWVRKLRAREEIRDLRAFPRCSHITLNSFGTLGEGTQAGRALLWLAVSEERYLIDSLAFCHGSLLLNSEDWTRQWRQGGGAFG